MASFIQGQKLVLVMVGLPARGKSYTARHLARYLTWLGYTARVFNLGEERRRSLGPGHTHEFFDPANLDAAEARNVLAERVLESLVAYLRGGGRVAIYDATNGTRERRRTIRDRCEREGFAVQFIELSTNDPKVIDRNVRETKLTSPDYLGVDPDEAVRDFRRRIDHYRTTYHRVGDDEGSYLRILDRGRKVVLHEIDGYLPARIVFFLSNLQISSRSIFLTRHGESLDNVAGRIGGDSALSPRGHQYARVLADWIDERFGPSGRLDVWSSTMRRALETAEAVGRPVSVWRYLDEIDAGACDGMTYDEIRTRMPNEYEARAADKLRYRYPRGESYQDVIQRLDRVIVELERHRTPVLIVGHQAVLRALYTYFRDVPLEQCPHTPIPLHTVIELAPRAYDCAETRIPLMADTTSASSG
jgi:broad specificity phosphatase PhoE/predicted kinase